MPLNAATLKTALKPEIIATLSALFSIEEDGQVHLEKFADGLADAISSKVVAHIVANALVTTVVVGTVTSGAGAGGTVAGSGTGTVS